MAYTSVIPVRRLDWAVKYVMNKEKTTAVSLQDALDYAANRDKTEQSCFESSYACTLETAFADMRQTKERWHKSGGVQGYHLVQSFAAGEVSPELAHQIAKELADRVLGGQYEYGFNTYQSDGNPYGGDAVFDVSFGAKADDSRFNLIGFDDENQFADLCSEDGEPLSGKKYYMTSAAAARYGIAAGDTFCFYNTVTLEETEVVIDGIVKNDILSLVLTGKENAAAILERPADEYNVIISREKLAIPGELLKKSSSLQDYRDMVEHLSSTAGIVLKLLKVLGVCICILIVVMICGMITEESSRNISMLEILGYRDREVRSFVLSSGHLLVPVGFVIGVPLGYLTAYSMVLASAQSSGMRMSLPVRAETILAAFVFVLVAYILALALSGRKIHRVDMAESLKNVEE